MSSTDVRIVADTFEREGGVPDALRAAGVDVAFRHLDVADYDVGSGVLIERKTVPDLHLSLQRGRLWRQVGELREAARWPCLLIEGASLDDRTTTPDAIWGACLAVLRQGVALIRSENAPDSARWLRLLAVRRAGVRVIRDRPVYAQRLKAPAELVPEAMLASVPGISVVVARRLLARFRSVTAVANATDDDLRTVPGVGAVRAEALRRALS